MLKIERHVNFVTCSNSFMIHYLVLMTKEHLFKISRNNEDLFLRSTYVTIHVVWRSYYIHSDVCSRSISHYSGIRL